MAKRKVPVQSSLLKNNLDLPKINALTQAQSEFFYAYDNYPHNLLLGSAGTGKTYLALYKALESINKGEANKLIIFRSSVSSRDPGFLPGTLQEKMSVYETPYRANVNKIMGRDDAYDLLVKVGTISFESSAFQRGNTLDYAIVIIDEAQNMSAGELDTLITRVGKNTRLIIVGDLFQQDLLKASERNVYKTIEVLKQLASVKLTEFGLEDIVRSGVVKEYLIKKYEMYRDGY